MTSREQSARKRVGADFLRAIQANTHPRVTYRMIEERTGIDYETVKRLMTNKTTLTLDYFVDIAEALGADPAETLLAFKKVISQ